MLVSLLSCSSNNQCNFKELGNLIIIENWKNTDFQVSKAELKNCSKQNIVNHHSIKNPLSDKVIIAFDTILDSKQDYILLLNDSIKYHISNFELFKETKMTGVSKIKLCTVKSIQINDKRISIYPFYNQIIFNKNLD